MASPHPEPTALKLIKGNPGKRAINHLEPILPFEFPSPPLWLIPEARKEWHRITRTLYDAGLLTTGDTAQFQQYCQSYGHWVNAEKVFKREGAEYTLTNDKGNVYMNPLLTALNQASERLMKCCGEFGLSPSSRSKVIAAPPDGVIPSRGQIPDKISKFFPK